MLDSRCRNTSTAAIGSLRELAIGWIACITRPDRASDNTAWM
jgi:hypothetical protein